LQAWRRERRQRALIICEAMRAVILGDGVMRIASTHHQIPIPLSARRVARTNRRPAAN
jgi:hypothetical protein